MNGHLSLFSGIGGLDLAAEWAGFRTVAFVERDKYCQRVLAKHWPEVPIFGDVCTFDASGYGPTVISGGFPCQPFSVAGKRLGEDDHRALWPEYLRIIKECRPAWVVGENVAGIIDMALDNVLADLEGVGYSARAFDIPACAVGADHQRRRIFIVANNGGVGRARSGQQQVHRVTALPGGKDGRGAQDIKTRSDIPSPHLCRASDGVPRRVDRLRALGNAVVPQQAYPIFKAIAEIEGINA